MEETRYLLDTLVRIAVYDSGLSRAKIDQAIDSAFQRIGQVERITSCHLPESELSLAVSRAYREPVPLPDELVRILNFSREVSESTSGAFDVTIGAVKNLWEFDKEVPRIPDKELLEQALLKVDYRKIHLQGSLLSLGIEDMSIDLGGVAKGFAVDEAVAALVKYGVRAGLVEAGGDLRTFGLPEGRETWKIGVRHPAGARSDLYGIISMGEMAVATSGDYERFFIHEGIQYHHLLDPETGYPARGCTSVTILAGTAMTADAYATAVFILGPEKGKKLLDSVPGVDGMIIFNKDGRLEHTATQAFLDRFSSTARGE